MTWLVFSSLICVFVTASFVDTRNIISRYDYDYPDIERASERAAQPNKHPQLLDLYQAFNLYQDNKENRRDTENEFENWSGRWMPDRPNDPTPPPKVLPKNQQRHYESVTEFPRGMYMGHVSPECDDGKTNLTIDWDRSPAAYTCYNNYIETNKKNINYYCEHIPKAYKAAHKCMNQTIEYTDDDQLPLYGPHRPLWPIYGEYTYLPKQRWLHSLEHGAIVMLYHPCANPMDVKHLKRLVRQCLWRHIITPYSDLNEDYPLTLLSWGCRLSMPYMNYAAARRFIQQRALRGPEHIADDGQFKEELLIPANIVTDPLDSVLCPR